MKKNVELFIIGKDYSHLSNKAAIETLKTCKDLNVTKGILQSRSPSCGFGKIYDGRFSGNLIEVNGYTTDLLHENGIEIFTDET